MYLVLTGGEKGSAVSEDAAFLYHSPRTKDIKSNLTVEEIDDQRDLACPRIR